MNNVPEHQTYSLGIKITFVFASISATAFLLKIADNMSSQCSWAWLNVRFIYFIAGLFGVLALLFIISIANDKLAKWIFKHETAFGFSLAVITFGMIIPELVALNQMHFYIIGFLLLATMVSLTIYTVKNIRTIYLRQNRCQFAQNWFFAIGAVLVLLSISMFFLCETYLGLSPGAYCAVGIDALIIAMLIDPL